MSEALEKIDRGALAALMSPEEIEAFNNEFAVGIGGDFLPTISIRGGKLRAKIEGEENELPSELPIVFLAARQCISKAYYDGSYNPRAEQKGPDCSSADGNYPDSNIEQPCSPTCQTCPNNAWGSRGNGSKGKACGDYQQVVVMIEGVDQAFSLRIPPTSFKPYKAYVKQMTMGGVPLIAAKTILTLVGDEFPVINLKYGGLVDRATFEQAKAWAAKPEVQTLVQIQPRTKPVEIPAQTAQQPVVVSTPEPTEEKAPAAKSLAELLGKDKPKAKAAPRKKKTVDEVIEESTAESAPVAEEPAPETSEAANKLNALLAKMKG